ncbi:uncharacterized protein LOC115702289 [Cannabis sativa]|uniref:uncharacterized protein LOC115702289 n=1 Tax=Cannabis sativa TaxID=3483 RepID=UPI0029CA3F52|nr:uncharacterized protein LOC115702289 [Cannabis sativa]
MTSPQVIGDPHYHISPYRYSYTTQPNTIEEEPHARYFTINLNAKFILAPHSSSMEVEDEESLFDDDAENSTTFLENIGWISYETLMKSDVTEALLNIEDMLAEVYIPSLSFIAVGVIDCGRKMMNNNDYDNNNLNEEVGVNISVEVFVDELPQLDDDDDDDDDEDDDFDMNDVPIRFVAAREESIEKLEKVWVKDNPIFCSICLEDVSVGLEAAKLPCTHAYHEECVVEWLQVSKFCPNCRVEIV